MKPSGHNPEVKAETIMMAPVAGYTEGADDTGEGDRNVQIK